MRHACWNEYSDLRLEDSYLPVNFKAFSQINKTEANSCKTYRCCFVALVQCVHWPACQHWPGVMSEARAGQW